MNKISISLLLIALLSLSACSHLNGQFDCPVAKGISCQSMSQIDVMANQGYFREPDNKPRLDNRLVFKLKNTRPYHAPLRVEERVLKVWFAPFIDSDDNYHEQSEVYTVVDKSFWQGNPVHSLKEASA